MKPRPLCLQAVRKQREAAHRHAAPLSHKVHKVPILIKLACRQSEWSLNRQPIRVSDDVQSSNYRHSETLQVESDPTLSVRFQKFPTRLNTPNRFVPKLILVSPNVSDVLHLGKCVPASTVICPELYHPSLTNTASPPSFRLPLSSFLTFSVCLPHL